ncbi:DUF4339 domain-containing protein [bacterium]|nr:DUF4339 domain-containing protein [bacterium]
MSTYMMVGGDGQEYGPIPADQLRQWVAEGRANGQTMVRPEGTETWVALGTVPEFADLFAAPAAGAPALPPPPVFLQGEAALDQALGRDYQLSIGDCISQGWKLVKNNFWLLVGGTAVLFLIQGALGSIPFLGALASLILGGPLTGGLYWLFLRVARGEDAQFGDIFAGFSRGFANLMLTQIVTGLLAVLCLVPGAVLLVAGIITGSAGQQPSAAMLTAPLAVAGIVLLVPGLIASIYLSVSWVFALPIVVDHQVGFWSGMQASRKLVGKHWWTILGFLIVVGLVAAVGVVLCCVGLLVTAPIAIGAMVVAYEQIAGTGSATRAT